MDNSRETIRKIKELCISRQDDKGKQAIQLMLNGTIDGKNKLITDILHIIESEAPDA